MCIHIPRKILIPRSGVRWHISSTLSKIFIIPISFFLLTRSRLVGVGLIGGKNNSTSNHINYTLVSRRASSGCLVEWRCLLLDSSPCILQEWHQMVKLLTRNFVSKIFASDNFVLVRANLNWKFSLYLANVARIRNIGDLSQNFEV